MEAARIAPQAPELEEAVLGALLLEMGAWTAIGDLACPEMFYDNARATIFRAAYALWVDGKKVDSLTVTQKLSQDGDLKDCGGAFYVSTLTNKVASTANIEYHTRILIERLIARKLLVMANETREAVYGAPDALELLDETSARVSDLYAFTQSTSLVTAADGIERLTDAAPSTHYTFGIEELDKVAVFEAGLPHVFAGRPGIGKSIIAIEICWHLTLSGNVLLFSPEMTLRQVQARILARETGVPYQRILRKHLDEQELHNVAACSMDIAGRLDRLKVDPTGGITPQQMRVRTERAMKTEGVIAFAVDHLHKMRTGDKRVDREETAKVSQCMEGVTEIAKNTGLPALVMCQLNREVEKRTGKKPTLADLKQTGKIEEDAAMVVLLFREGYYAENPPMVDRLEMGIAKYRDGSVGTCYADITPAYSRIGPPPMKQPIKAPF